MKTSHIRVASIHIKCYRGIDELEMEFPIGRMTLDPDVNILGSKNGVGKTSVLECCAWALLAATSGKEAFESSDFDFADIVKSGCRQADIFAELVVAGEKYDSIVKFNSQGIVEASGIIKPFVGKKSNFSRRAVDGIVGRYPDPVLGKKFFFLHSYRKVQEGKPEFGMLLDDEDIRYRRRISMPYMDRGPSFSMFKRLIVRHMMEGADLFEEPSLRQSGRDKDALAALNGLLETYANVHIGKLRPYKNNTIDVQVERKDEPGRGFSIDGLSSGQKEVISTLFLIWNATYKNPSVVLIDEPELHLNIQWHAGFVRKLLELAPDNQYVLATHSEDIMASVGEKHRHLLLDDDSNKSGLEKPL